MTADNAPAKNAAPKVQDLLDSEVYRDNLNFWERAWSPVKTPYTQLPDLEYLPWILDYLNQGEGKRVLDIGCGSGWLSIYLARRGFEVTGLDISANAIRLGNMWAEQEGLKITFDTGDMAAMPYREHSFDAVVANSIFEHLPYELAVTTMEQLRRSVRPQGRFVGCFDKVGGGPGEYFELQDGTHVYTDKGRRGMLLRYFSDQELRTIFTGYTIDRFDILETGSRFVCAHL